MILVSLGNLGDLLIQAAFLRTFDRPGVSLAVPESYRSMASELFPAAAIIPMPDRWSDGRELAKAQTDRATAVASILKELGSQFPGMPVKSIALTDDVILDRALNIYEAYRRVLGRDFEIAGAISPTTLPSRADEWIPFDHLPRWESASKSKRIYFCPWGGIGVKNIPAEELARLRDGAVRLGYDTRLLASTRDDVSAHSFFPPEEVVRLPDERLISEAAMHLSEAALVVAVDTAWYHLAAMIGAPVLGLSGPRSLRHFEFPGRKRAQSLPEQRLCADCFSTDRCVVTGLPGCEARPDANQMIAALEANLSGATMPEAARDVAPFDPPARLRRSVWRAAFHGIDFAQKVGWRP